MKNLLITLLVATGLLLFTRSTTFSQRTSPLIIDHTCLDLSQIPLNWIDSVQANHKWHYGHTSHGSQLTTGLERIEDDDITYDVSIGSMTLPNVPGTLCIFDGQEDQFYILPEYYWKTAEGMNKTRTVLNNNPEMTISQWSWCIQLNAYSAVYTQDYLDSISVLEAEFPDVTFIYMTGNTQQGPGNHTSENLPNGYNRHLRNEQIRTYCDTNNKVLYDFADIECWWYNDTTLEWEFSTYRYKHWDIIDSVDVPFEHPHYNFDEAGHSSYENCENKGKAVWWLMAQLSGWISLEVTWTGNISTDWNDTGNWNPNIVPDSTMFVTIPVAPAGGRFPDVTSGIGGQSKYIEVQNGSEMDIQSGGQVTIGNNGN